jgi:protein TonB
VPSDGESRAPPVILPLDLVAAHGGTSADRRRLEDWLAVAAAALLHGLIILWLLFDWRIAFAPPEPEAIPVRLVVAPPVPEPAPPPAPAVPPRYRESGKDERTTAAPAAEVPAPEAASPPPAAEATPQQTAPEHAKPERRKEALRTPSREKAATARAPRRDTAPRIEVEPGERNLSGDPYLNRLLTLLESHRVYPNAVGRFGLPVEGVAIYYITVDRRGNVTRIALVGSSGVPALDKAGERMIRNAAPFPPLPADIPGNEIPLTLTLPLYPDRP